MYAFAARRTAVNGLSRASQSIAMPRALRSAPAALRVQRTATPVLRLAPRRVLSGDAAAATAGGVTRYSKGLATLHWAIALGTVGCFVTVKQQQATKVPAEKGMWMWRHKSLGALLAILVPIRIGVALTSRRPPSVSTNMLESIGAKVSHAGLYFIMVFMPVSGITMGYFGGKGIPFFFTKIEGKSAEEKTPEDGALAKQAFINHKRVGQVLPYWVGIHAGAVGYHAAFKGTNLLKRMSPF